MSRSRFADRAAAGRALGAVVAEQAGLAAGDRSVVLGLPRGGVVVAVEVAATLGTPLDVLVVRKLGLPAQPELAMGAIAAVGDSVETVRVDSVIVSAGVDDVTFAAVRDRELVELRRREHAYRAGRPALDVAGRQVLLVDDGLATGATMRAAVRAARGAGAAVVTVAVPIGSPRAVAALAPLADGVVCPAAPEDFRSVGQAYRDFGQTSDDEVRRALSERRSDM
ncbi:UNVERIFIED_ORG: phosphoribosyltransferase [Bacillus sp. AZ43]